MTDGAFVQELERIAQHAAAPGWFDEKGPLAGVKVRYALVPERMRVEVLDPERHLPHPHRKKGSLTFRDVDSFVSYVKKHAGKATLVLAENRRLTAIIDHHSEEAAGWGEHRATLEFAYTREWTAWTGFAGSWIPQQAFAEFLEDNIAAVASPDGAELMEVALNLRASMNATYQKAVVLQTGQVQFVYQEELSAGSATKGELFVPEVITLRLRCFEGGELFDVPVRLRWSLREGAVKFLIKIGDEAAAVFERSFEAARTSVAAALELPVLLGSGA